MNDPFRDYSPLQKQERLADLWKKFHSREQILNGEDIDTIDALITGLPELCKSICEATRLPEYEPSDDEYSTPTYVLLELYLKIAARNMADVSPNFSRDTPTPTNTSKSNPGNIADTHVKKLIAFAKSYLALSSVDRDAIRNRLDGWEFQAGSQIPGSTYESLSRILSRVDTRQALEAILLMAILQRPAPGRPGPKKHSIDVQFVQSMFVFWKRVVPERPIRQAFKDPMQFGSFCRAVSKAFKVGLEVDDLRSAIGDVLGENEDTTQPPRRPVDERVVAAVGTLRPGLAKPRARRQGPQPARPPKGR